MASGCNGLVRYLSVWVNCNLACPRCLTFQYRGKRSFTGSAFFLRSLKIMSQKSRIWVMSLRERFLEFKASSRTSRKVWLLIRSCFKPFSAPARDWRARLEARAELSASWSITKPPAASWDLFGVKTSPVAICPTAMSKIKSNLLLKYGEGSERISCIMNLSILSFRTMPKRTRHSQAFRRTLSALPS